MKPIIGLTIGDPAGIGPEVVLKSIARFSSKIHFVVYGDLAYLTWLNQKVLKKNRLPSADYRDLNNVRLSDFRIGRPSAMGGKASLEAIKAGTRAALKNEINALVTAPINKEELRLGGASKQQVGHTEILAQMTHAKRVALMLVHGHLRAVHVTSHIPLKEVASSLTSKRIFETIILAQEGCKKMGIAKPRIAVCGLNPHAGDNGILGDEEKKIILPAIKQSVRRNIRAEGPFSADTVWPMVRDRRFDVGIAMYHDQGQIPIKFSSFSKGSKGQQVEGINITLGLPIIRTSPAHGTAYDIAGKGIASAASFQEAIQMAVSMARSKL